MAKKNIEKLVKDIIRFNVARGWTPKPSDLAKSIVIESSELLEHFQWDETDTGLEGIKKKDWEEIGEEVADVFWYLATFCHSANINLAEVVQDKIDKNEKKYPENRFKGKHNDKFYKNQKKKYRAKKK